MWISRTHLPSRRLRKRTRAGEAKRDASIRGFLGAEAEDKIIDYTHMVEVFEANCEAVIFGYGG